MLGGNVDPFAAVLDAAQRPDRPAAYLLEYALHVLRRFGTLSNAESLPVLYRHFRRAHLGREPGTAFGAELCARSGLYAAGRTELRAGIECGTTLGTKLSSWNRGVA